MFYKFYCLLGNNVLPCCGVVASRCDAHVCCCGMAMPISSAMSTELLCVCLVGCVLGDRIEWSLTCALFWCFRRCKIEVAFLLAHIGGVTLPYIRDSE